MNTTTLDLKPFLLLIVVTIFGMSFYLILVKRYGEKVEYVFLTKEEHYGEEDGFVKPKVTIHLDNNIHVESQSQEKSMREQI